ncbi:hypothetical protein AB4Y36_10305 [Paraburkholderia sp. BR10936]
MNDSLHDRVQRFETNESNFDRWVKADENTSVDFGGGPVESPAAAIAAIAKAAESLVDDYAKNESPTFTGIPKAPTADSGDVSEQIANTEFVADTVAPVAQNVDALTEKVSGLAPIDSPEFSGIPKVPTADEGTATEQAASTEYTVRAIAKAIQDLIGGAPDALDTLKELAAALGDDADFAANLTNTLATKADITYVDLQVGKAVDTITSSDYTKQLGTAYDDATIYINATNDTPAYLKFEADGVPMWDWAQGKSADDHAMILNRYNNGVVVDQVINVNNTTGLTTFNKDLAFAGVTVTNNANGLFYGGNLNFSTTASGNGDLSAYIVQRSGPGFLGLCWTDGAGDHYMRMYGSNSGTPGKVEVVGQGGDAFYVSNGYSTFAGRVYFNAGPAAGGSGGELGITNPQGTRMYIRGRDGSAGSGLEFVNNAYNAVVAYMNDDGTVGFNGRVTSNNSLAAGSAVMGTDGNLYMPFAGDYLSNKIMDSWAASGNGWIRWRNGFTIAWGSFSGNYWTFPRYMGGVWALAGASNSSSGSGAANNIWNISNTGCNWHTYNDVGGWGIVIGNT